MSRLEYILHKSTFVPMSNRGYKFHWRRTDVWYGPQLVYFILDEGFSGFVCLDVCMYVCMSEATPVATYIFYSYYSGQFTLS